jgi:hypothetical protein
MIAPIAAESARAVRFLFYFLGLSTGQLTLLRFNLTENLTLLTDRQELPKFLANTAANQAEKTDFVIASISP